MPTIYTSVSTLGVTETLTIFHDQPDLLFNQVACNLAVVPWMTMRSSHQRQLTISSSYWESLRTVTHKWQ